MIGGLMSDRQTTSENKVPLLGDIPVLGYLFKYKSKSKEKRNLLVLLTPYVIQGPARRRADRRAAGPRAGASSSARGSTFKTMRYRPNVDYRAQARRARVDQPRPSCRSRPRPPSCATGRSAGDLPRRRDRLRRRRRELQRRRRKQGRRRSQQLMVHRAVPLGASGHALIGELLVRDGLSPAHLERALEIQREEGGRSDRRGAGRAQGPSRVGAGPRRWRSSTSSRSSRSCRRPTRSTSS